MKRLLSFFLITALIITSSTAAFANESNQASINKSERTSIGNYQYEVIQYGSDIIVNEYDGDDLISKTLVNMNKDEMVKKYIDSEEPDKHLSKEKMIDNYNLSTLLQNTDALSAAASWTTYGKYSLQGKNTLTGSLFTTDALLKYYVSNTDSESYTIGAAQGDAVSFVVGLCANILLLFLTSGASLAAQLATQVIAAGGSYVVNGVIQKAFQHNVGVNATYYKTNYTTISGGGTGSVFDGKKVQVTTQSSQYYNKIYYEGHAPQRYSNNAYTAFLNTYMGGQNVTFVKMLSFNAY